MAAVINAVVAKALYDTQVETITAFKAFIADKDDVDMDFMNELIEEFQTKLQADYKPPKGAAKAMKDAGLAGGKGKKRGAKAEGDEPKAKRALSAYILFIKYKMNDTEFRAENTEAKGKALMSAAIAVWAGLDDDIKNKMKDLHKENPEMDGKQLYEKAAGVEADAASEAEPEPEEPKKKATKSKKTKKPAAAETDEE